MLEYFAFKKYKKHKVKNEAKDKETQRTAEFAGDSDKILEEHPREQHKRSDGNDPVLGPDDESFLEKLLARTDGPAPPLPPRHYADELNLASGNDVASVNEPSSEQDTASKSPAQEDKNKNRLSLFFTRNKRNEDGLKPAGVPPEEGERERKDLSRVLDRLNLSAQNNKVISTQSSEVLQKFTQVFKDIVNGVPTAYDDLAKLIEDRDGTLSRGFEKLPSSLRKLVTQLPEKITGSLGPEILAAAAGKQGIKADASGGIKGTAKKILLPHNLAELVTKPGAIVGMLRAIVEVLKTRWPAFIGMNVLWSVALSLLLFVLWYCHKRGREVRLEQEKLNSTVDGSDRIEELPDDPPLPAPEPAATHAGEADAKEADAKARTVPTPSSELSRPSAADPDVVSGSRAS